MLLSFGDYKQGFVAYEHRWQAHKDILKTPPFADRIARWEGEILEERSILVCTEQGFGDSIQFIRYLQLMRKKHPKASIFFYGHISLEKLFESLLKPLKIKMVDNSKTVIPKTNFYCSLVSLPYFLGVTSSATSYKAPYLAPHPDSYQWLKDIGLFTKHKFRVGLCLKGNPSLKRDKFRTIPEDYFDKFFSPMQNQFEWIDLQKDSPLIGEYLIHPLKDAKSFSDSAAIISSCDIVLTVDTVIAHIAGALGKTTIMLNRYDSDWRWKLGNPTSVWYPTIFIMSQRMPGDWSWPMQKAKDLVSIFSQMNSVPMLEFNQLP
jgi:ADP-heptose:LPS heptosyltransferase